MAYFPRTLMPLTPKENSPSANVLSPLVLITAEDYNLHDEEIRAIEEFMGFGGLGAFPGLGLNKRLGDLQPNDGLFDPAVGTLDSDRATGGLLDDINVVIDEVNVFTDGVGSSSGLMHNGDRIIFPEDAQITELTALPQKSDRTISVRSTTGFPDQGVITIINDVQQALDVRRGPSTAFVERVSGGTTMVEWIRYSDKTATQFQGCQRGWLSTTIGPHTGEISNPRERNRLARNLRNLCFNTAIISGLTICRRRWPAWRRRKRLDAPIFGHRDTPRGMRRFIRRSASMFRISPASSGQDVFNKFSMVARGIGASDSRPDGLLAQRVDGTFFLESASAFYRKRGKLSGAEVRDLVKAMLDAELIVVSREVEDFEIGSSPIPVFQGRMSLQASLAAVTRSDNAQIDALQVQVTADGRILMFIENASAQDQTLQAVTSYQTFFLPSPATSDVRSNQ